MRHPIPLFVSLVLSWALVWGSIATPAPATPAPHWDPDSLLAIKPALRQEIAAALPATLPEYTIHLEMPANSDTLPGAMTLQWTNSTGQPLSNIPFRLFANDPTTDALEIHAATVNGDAVDVALSVNDTVATVALQQPLEPGQSVTIGMDFSLVVPTDARTYYGILNHDTGNSVWSLTQWYPMLAVYEPGHGWMLDSTSRNGDPIFTDTGMYDVYITAPDDLQFVTSGVVESVNRLGDGRTETHWNAKPSRDFAIVADTTMDVTTIEADGTTVHSWSQSGHDKARENAARWSADTLRMFNPLLGEYPYRNLAVLEMNVYNAAGVELPQMFVIGKEYYPQDGSDYLQEYFEFTVAHEVLHMWFYNMVGNNQYRHAFIDESLVNYLSSRVYFTRAHGANQGASLFASNIEDPFRRGVENNNDVVVDFPTDSYPTMDAYVFAVYIKGPVGFAAINDAMGDEAFFAALQEYVTQFRFRIATPDDLEAAFQRHTDADISALWTHWFERREGALDVR